MMSIKKNLSLILMGIIIIAFFLPWYKFEFFSTITISGYGIISFVSKLINLTSGHSRDSQIIYLVYLYLLIPIMAGIALFTGIVGNKNLLSIMIRITSIITVLLCFVPDILIALDPKSSDIADLISIFTDSGKSFGFYLSVGTAVVAFIVSFMSDSQIISHSQGNTGSSINQNSNVGNEERIDNNSNNLNPINQQQINAAINSSKEALSQVFVELKGKEIEQLAYLGFGLIVIIGLLKQVIVSSSFSQYFGAIILIGISILAYFKFPMLLMNQEFNGEFYLFTKQIDRLTGSLKWLNKIKESTSTASIVTLVIIAIFTLTSTQDRELTSLVSFITVFADYFLFLVVSIMLGKGELKDGANAIIILSVIGLIKLMKDLFISMNYLNIYYGVKFLAFWTLGWYILLIARQITLNERNNVQHVNSPTNQDVNM